MRFVFLSCVLLGCGAALPSTDAGAPDAGAPDARAPDASAALDDAGAALDAALPDASMPDGGDAPSFRAAYPIDARHAEGGIYDGARHAFYVGSLADGSVHAIDAATGAERTLFTPTEAGAWWTLGMDVDEETGHLYVCAMEDLRGADPEPDPPYHGYVWVLDVESGERVAVHDLADAHVGATCTDVALAADGSAYVCDRESPRIYRLAPDGALSIVADDPLLDGGLVGQNALVVLPDQSALLSIVYLPSRLVYVRLADGAAHEVAIDGDFSDGLPVLSGADGMAWDDGSVLVAFTSQLNRVTPTLGDWSTAVSTTVDVPAGMTDVVQTPGGAYLLNGQAVDFAFGREPEPTQLVRFEGDL